jgi:hypothetical protein
MTEQGGPHGIWIPSYQALGRHPKTLRLARVLDVSVPTAIGHLQLVWWWAVDYAENGDLSRYDDADVAEAAMWEGEPGQFVAALKECKFLEEHGWIHDWDDYAGKLIAKRKANAQRMRDARAANVQNDVRARVRPEKRRVEKKREEHKERTSTASPNGSATRKRDEFFEAVVEICQYDLAHITESDRSNIGRTAKELKAVNATPPLIRGFLVMWEEAHPDIAITPQVIRNNWATYMAGNIKPLERRR